MASRKVFDLTVKTGEYQSGGETKGRYENVGSVMQSDDGRQFIMLKRTFNPAGVPDLSGRGGDSVLVSMFEPKQDRGQQTYQKPSSGAPVNPPPSGGGFGDDDLPF